MRLTFYVCPKSISVLANVGEGVYQAWLNEPGSLPHQTCLLVHLLRAGQVSVGSGRKWL